MTHISKRGMLPILSGILVAGLMASSVPVLAQGTYPDRPITLIVPYPAGGGTDTTHRLVAEQLATRLGQPVVILNREGAGGNIGMEAGASAQPDGYTLTALTPNYVVNPHTMLSTPYDPLTAFEPVSLLARTYSMIVAASDVPADDLATFISYASANPGQLLMGHGGTGGQGFLTLSRLALAAGIDLVPVAYAGENPIVVDLLSGELDISAMAVSGSALAGHLAQGNLKGYAVTSPERLASFPDIPAASETIEGFSASGWQGIGAPAGTPPEIVAKISEALAEALADADLATRLQEMGMDPVGSTPAEFAAHIASEFEVYGEILRAAGVEPQ